ncbi:hypothetical protein ACFLYS_02950 [Chloroflexota bacterium]
MNNEFTPTQLNQRDLDRIRKYKEFLDFYHGKHWLGNAGRSEKQLTFNYAKVVIDKVVTYLMSGLHFSIEPLVDSEEARQQAKAAETALQQAEMVTGRKTAVIFFDEHNPKEAAVIAVYN